MAGGSPYYSLVWLVSLYTIFPCFDVANKIETIMRDFLWFGVGDDKNDREVSWGLVCRPKDERGLGLDKLV